MIDTARKQLQELRDKEKITRRTFIDILDWLDEHRFYLLPADCEMLNSLIEEIDARLDAQDPSNVTILRRSFAPDPTMNVKMYYEME